MGRDDYANKLDAEAREAINETLIDLLPKDGWGHGHWETLVRVLREQHHIETDVLGLLQSAPQDCLIRVFQLGAFAREDVIKKETITTITDILRGLVTVAYHADAGDESARKQLDAIHKLVFPKVYRLPSSVVQRLVDSYHTSPHLARAWSVRSIMERIALVLVPVREGVSLLDGAVKLTTIPTLIDSAVYQRVNQYIKPGSTLQSLAIDIYQDQLRNEGIEINDERQLKLDLQKLRKWEDEHLDDNLRNYYPLRPVATGNYPTAFLPVIPMYSEGWKSKWRRGDKS